MPRGRKPKPKDITRGFITVVWGDVVVTFD